MSRDLGDVIAAVFYVAILALLVRPNSVAPAFITAFGSALTAIVRFAGDSGPAAGPGNSGVVYA